MTPNGSRERSSTRARPWHTDCLVLVSSQPRSWRFPDAHRRELDLELIMQALSIPTELMTDATMSQRTQNLPGGTSERKSRADREDLLIVGMMIGVGALAIVLAVLRGGGWGVQPTLGMLMVFFALRQLTTHFVQPGRERRRFRRQRSTRRLGSDSED